MVADVKVFNSMTILFLRIRKYHIVCSQLKVTYIIGLVSKINLD